MDGIGPVDNAWDTRTRLTERTVTHAQGVALFLLSFDSGDGAEAATTQASRRSKRVTRGQPATPKKLKVTLATRSGVTQIVIFLTH